MPASRSAAATTLAPRSCPSRPGLPTRTRILRCMRSSPRDIHARSATVGHYTASAGSPLKVRLQRERAPAVLVASSRFLEVLGRSRNRVSLIVERPPHDAEALEQQQGRAGAVLGLEVEGAVFTVAAQGLDPPRHHTGRASLEARRGEIPGVERGAWPLTGERESLLGTEGDHPGFDVLAIGVDSRGTGER